MIGWVNENCSGKKLSLHLVRDQARRFYLNNIFALSLYVDLFQQAEVWYPFMYTHRKETALAAAFGPSDAWQPTLSANINQTQSSINNNY